MKTDTRVLVTGGAGYIGAHTVHLLLRRGYDVTVIDDLSRGHAHNVERHRLVRLSLADREGLARVFEAGRFAAVVHFAAYIAVGESMTRPELYFSNNVGGTMALASAMIQAGVPRLVFSSTAAVYGNLTRGPLSEDLPLDPMSPYGESKAMAEKVLGWLDQCRGLRSITLRYFNACGSEPGAGLGEEHEPETHLIPLLFRAIRTGEAVTVYGNDYDTPDGTPIRDYVHVSDLAEAHILALESLLAGGTSGVFNAGTGAGRSVLEVIRAVEEVSGCKVPWVAGPRRPGDAAVLVADASRLRNSLSWQPRYTDLREIVATAWEFEQSHNRASAR